MRFRRPQGIDAADPRAVGLAYLLVPRPDAMEDGDPRLVGKVKALARPFEIEGRHDPRVPAVAELRFYVGIERA